MIVVADSSPLNYLVLLGHAELLHRFYDQVVVPEAVAAELSSPAAPAAVRDWIKSAPAWLSIVPVDAAHILQVTDELDAGERAAIALAVTVHADLLLLDDALLALDPGDWLEDDDRAALHRALAESELDVKAGRLVDADVVLRRLRSR